MTILPIVITGEPVLHRPTRPVTDFGPDFQRLIEDMYETDPDCTYNIAAGETAGFTPITHEAYETIVEVRKAKSN